LSVLEEWTSLRLRKPPMRVAEQRVELRMPPRLQTHSLGKYKKY
jgi:hypothetical protein